MNIEYNNGDSSCGVSLLFYTTGDPFAYKTTTESEMRLQNRDEHDPEQAPRPGRGDRYILACALAGIVIGGAAGAIIGYHFLDLVGGIYGLLGGVILGGVIGTFIGSGIKKRVLGKGKINTKSIPTSPDNVGKAC
jgi:predicted lipid-binding transport protein (Tim44 family)